MVGQQMRQAQQAQVDQMARVRRDVQQSAQQRTQLRTAALEARLAREERLAESAAKTKALRLAASKKPETSPSTLVASTDPPSKAKPSSR
jgi:membrane protein involved in colicin uptake